jgi:hypothetical protein
MKLPTEHDEQALFVQWFRASYPNVLIYAIPNAGLRHVRHAVKLKDEGVVSGIPDLHVPEYALWIEMKRQKGGVLSQAQKDIIRHLQDFNTVIVAKGCEDAMKQVSEYMSSYTSIDN